VLTVVMSLCVVCFLATQRTASKGTDALPGVSVSIGTIVRWVNHSTITNIDKEDTKTSTKSEERSPKNDREYPKYKGGKLKPYIASDRSVCLQSMRVRKVSFNFEFDVFRRRRRRQCVARGV